MWIYTVTDLLLFSDTLYWKLSHHSVQDQTKPITLTKHFYRCWFRLILGFFHLNHCLRGHFLRPRILVRAIGRRHQRRGRRWTRFGLHCLPNGLGKIAFARALVNFVLCHVVFLGTWFRICFAWNCVDRNVWWLSQIEKSQGKKIHLRILNQNWK